MFVAIDRRRNRVVSGRQCSHETDTENYRFQCLFCDESLAYNPESGDLFDYFTHVDAPTCLREGGSSRYHRVGQELISQRACTMLPVAPQNISIGVEKHVGPQSGFRIADVLIQEPIQLVIEVVYQTSVVNLRDRLETAFADGYGAMVAILQNADVSAARVEQHLSRVGSIEVATIDPHRGTVEIGSVIRPETVTLAPTAWESVPAYLA
jgi:hypothetical protein